MVTLMMFVCLFFPASFLCFILESFWCYVFKNTDLVSAVSDPL